MEIKREKYLQELVSRRATLVKISLIAFTQN